MTGLRIGKVGPGEVLILIWCLKYLPRYTKLNIKNRHFLYWVSFLFCVFTGTSIGLLFYPNQVIPSQIFTWLFLMFISKGIYIGLKDKAVNEIEHILNSVAIYGIVWNLFLYLYSIFVKETFFNAPLWYGGVRFSGGGINPHQISVFLSSIIFICYRKFLYEDNMAKKIKYIILILIGLFLALETGSATLILAISLTALIAGFLWNINTWKNQKTKLILSILIILISFILLLFTYDLLIYYIDIWIQSDPNGYGRFEIFSTFGDTISKSFLFGLGPGSHAFGGIIEYHNTYLEIIAMSGMVGFIIFSIYSVSLFMTLKVDYTLMLIILPLYIYGVTGFAMRRLVYWAILMIVIVLAEKITYKSHPIKNSLNLNESF